MSFTDYFEQAFCINLDSRNDRWKKAVQEFEKVGISVERVPAIDGSTLPPSGLKPGAAGCKASHLKVFEMARERSLKSFLLLEDDVVFDDNFNDEFDRLPIPENFSMLYLGINPFTGERLPMADRLWRLKYTYSSHAVIFRERCYDDIISELSKTITYQCDVIYGEFQSIHPAYGVYPSLAWQREGFSDIEQCYVDYSFMRQP
jgi:hypothetical protein